MAFPTSLLPAATTWFTGLVTAAKIQANIIDPLNTLVVDDTGWIALTITASNFSASTPTPKYRRIGSVVSLTGILQRSVVSPSGSGFNGTAIFAALPSNCWPASFNTFVVPGGTVGAQMHLRAFADGTIQIRNQGSVDLAANAGLGIDCTWIAG